MIAIQNDLRTLLRHSYAPYSKLHFACLVESTNGARYGGVNVENASFGGTICAERNALNAAVAAGERQFRALYLMGSSVRLLMPCAICKQSFLEFFDDAVNFHIFNKSGAYQHFSYIEILRTVFDKNDMKRM